MAPQEPADDRLADRLTERQEGQTSDRTIAPAGEGGPAAVARSVPAEESDFGEKTYVDSRSHRVSILLSALRGPGGERVPPVAVAPAATPVSASAEARASVTVTVTVSGGGAPSAPEPPPAKNPPATPSHSAKPQGEGDEDVDVDLDFEPPPAPSPGDSVDDVLRGEDLEVVPSPPPLPQAIVEGERPRRRTRRAAARKREHAWFDSFFTETFLHTATYMTPEATLREVKFAEACFELSRGDSVLDLGCGNGRHAIELAARGYRVTGVDKSRPLLEHAALDAQRRGAAVELVHADFRDIDFESAFDGVLCLNSTFGVFDDDTNRRMLHAVSRSLRRGGRLLLDVVNRDYILRFLPLRLWWEGRGCIVLEDVSFNYFTSRIEAKRSIVFEDGRHFEQALSLRAYSLQDLGKLLHNAGLGVLEVSGHIAHRRRFFGRDSRLLILLAERGRGRQD